MYQFSRAIYRDLCGEIIEPETLGNGSCGHNHNHQAVLQACEKAIERLALDRHYFAKPARTLFNDVRMYFPMTSQYRVYRVIEQYMTVADEFFQELPRRGLDVNGNPLSCRATTRKGTACQRMPLPRNGYCPSHQHLAETEDVEFEIAA
jgi:hypothetical protein